MESVIDENFMPSIKEEKIELNNLDETEKDPQIPVKKKYLSLVTLYIHNLWKSNCPLFKLLLKIFEKPIITFFRIFLIF